MSKSNYRIMKRERGEIYKIQKRIILFFWKDINIFRRYYFTFESVKEAFEKLQIYKKRNNNWKKAITDDL